MAIWTAVFLGLVQGLTEFLPVSSSGHLILVQKLFGMQSDMLLFNIILHLATLCAVVVVFRQKIWVLVRNPFCKTNYCLLIATLLTCTIVVAFKDFIDTTMNAYVLPFTFLITAIVLFGTSLVSENKGLLRKKKEHLRDKSSYKSGEIEYETGIIAGIAQGVAVIPGISRSGSTISACIYSGAKREAAAEFSFLMSIPVIIASFLFEIISGSSDIITVGAVPLIVAFISALFAGIFAIKVMIHVVQNVKLYWFSVYLVALSVVLLFVFYF